MILLYVSSLVLLTENFAHFNKKQKQNVANRTGRVQILHEALKVLQHRIH